MPRIEITRQPELTQPRVRFQESLDEQRSLVLALSYAMDEHEIRYCALHVLGGALYRADFAVHPSDKGKLGAVLSRLRDRGYLPVQWLELTAGTQRIFFVRLHGSRGETIAIDFIFRSRSAFTPIARLVSRRERENNYWVPRAEDWFEYLVADCALDGGWCEDGIKQLQVLITQLGKPAAEQQVEVLLGRGQGKAVVSALLSNDCVALAADPGWRLRKRVLLRHPSHPLRLWIARLGCMLRSLIKPKGAFVVFLGPDGVGKTTLLREVSEALARFFPICSVYRWRPGVFARAPRPACLPHSKPLRNVRGSISYLLFVWTDFIAGYLWETRWTLAQNGLVIFDRYYHDILVDPVRYRYAGPHWLLRRLARLILPHDVFFFVLDADEHTILSRKQQLPPEEIRRQRAAYRKFAGETPAATIIETNRPIEECRREALQQCFGYLSRQLAKRHSLDLRYDGIASFQADASNVRASIISTPADINAKKANLQDVSAASEKVHAASEMNY